MEKCLRREANQIYCSDSWANTDRAHWQWSVLHVDELHLPENADILNDVSAHPLALADAKRERHPPKYERFDDGEFLILREDCSVLNSNTFVYASISCFIKGNHLITVYANPSAALEKVQAEIIDKPQKSPKTAQDLMLRVARIVTDHFSEHLYAIEDILDDYEESLSQDLPDAFLQQVLATSNLLKRMARSLRYQRAAITALSKEQDNIHRETEHLIQDLLENVDRTASMAQLLSEISTEIMNAFLSLHAHRLNRIMQILTVLTAVFLPITFIAGLYGMNFEHIPELKIHYGYFIALGVMLSIAVSMLLFFRKLKWL